jgi:hypothetical protein
MGRPFVRLFADSSYIAFDTITRNETKYVEPYASGKFTVNNDTLWLDDSWQRIIKLANDTLIFERIGGFNDRVIIDKTLLLKRTTDVDLNHFNFPKNKIDTITKISPMSMNVSCGRELNYYRFERTYLYHNDTIYRVVRDVPKKVVLKSDSLIRDCNEEFQSYDMGEYGNQAGVGGHYYEIIDYSYQNYTTFYVESHSYNKVQLGALHGDWYHGFYTIDSNGNDVLLSDLIKQSAKTTVNFLIADAIISYRKKTGWLDVYDEAYCRSIRIYYANLDYENRVALGKDGLIVSLDYGQDDARICYAENYVHAIVPYNLIRPYLLPPFKEI